MNATQIKDKLSAIVDELLSCLDAEGHQAVQNLFYIAGGAIVSLALDEAPVDYDVFCETAEVARVFQNACRNPSFPIRRSFLPIPRML